MERGFSRSEGGRYVCDFCGLRVKVTASKFPAESVKHACGGVARVRAKAGNTNTPTTPQDSASRASQSNINSIPGPGTRLKATFESLGILPTKGCKCNQIRDDMDQLGPEWCRKSIDGLVKRVEQEANRRKLLRGVPFKKWFVRGMILRAVREYEREVESAKAAAAAAKANAESII